ncbi:MAG: hypothetical protein HY675_13620 [Chloroflexi bacterium]|nr:hypothetical protein [Chloroflexota bacterium]
MMRRIGTAFLAIVILMGVALGYTYRESAKDALVDLIGVEARDQLVGIYLGLTSRTPNTADLAPMDNTGLNPFGVNVFLEQEVEEIQIRRTLQMIKDAGFGWIKQQVLWDEIEIPEKGEYYDEKNDVDDTWAKWDRIVNLADEYGLRIIARLDGTPQWARPGNPKLETPPDDFADYGDFVYAFVGRYRGKVKHYQIWNEPNRSFEWGNRPVSAPEYVRLLQIAYIRAKQADPDAVILSAALAPTIEVSERAVNDVIFLQQMYDAGAKNYFDVMSTNPYGLRSGPYDRRLDEEKDVNFSRSMLIREVMVRNGDENKPIWASEMGWNALPLDFPEEPLFGRVTPQEQARYTVQGFRRILEEWPWMGVVNLWHFRRVHAVNQNEQMYYFSLVDRNFNPYPVYEAVRSLATSSPVAYRGFHQEDHWAVKYGGAWEVRSDPNAALGEYRRSRTSGDALSFTFKGTELELVVRLQETSGRFLVTVDGSPANKLPRDDRGRAYLDLQSFDDEWQSIVPVAGGLSNGLHEAVLMTAPGDYTSGGDLVWDFDGFVVDVQPPIVNLLLAPVLSTLLGIAVGWTGGHLVGRRARTTAGKDRARGKTR